jgi:hypothetical protein
MYRYAIIPLIVLISSMTLLTSCSEQKPAAPAKAKVENLATTPEDIRKEAKELAATTMAYTEEQKAQYQKKIQEKLAQYNQNFMELQAKLVMMNEQAKADLAAEMKKLDDKKAAVATKVKELQGSSGEAWTDLKAGMDKAFMEMDKAYDQAKSRFEK